MARSLNKVTLIGNLTRDPELRYTPQGTAVCTFGVATNRQWTTEAGEKKEDAEFHRVVAWNKLAEICSQLLTKGRKVYVEGRLQTRSWTGQDGNQRTSTEIVINDMIILDSRRDAQAPGEFEIPEEVAPEAAPDQEVTPVAAESKEKKGKKTKGPEPAEGKKKGKKEAKEEAEEDIPF
ncbi:MAG: Single-stranded DNA-binding protein [Candidatus Woesebacteria bacterium GW2011_GWA2_44_33]|uniref:Single-stranded DNA-binding protein n=3 Tax=Microgenomates group TaxID=1794810 RepID=A0A0G1QFC0_9BACT|nr:MAG: Single-stranded DNA-binding protein [Candidatus Woesebacteria bacterium GW2011_GWA2_44_33]KKT66337.1 MAG: Single-stranded DNA-binding protein [Candidatus Curtissbacteria bacterium GW2011_GWC1_44_33]KKU16463.1 MAG: Single-stranded DNA-binding protein [Candidatus Woesebacteria bacterium GW2011_GWC2_45_9]